MCLGKAKENVPSAGDHFTHVGVLDEAPGLELAQPWHGSHVGREPADTRSFSVSPSL